MNNENPEQTPEETQNPQADTLAGMNDASVAEPAPAVVPEQKEAKFNKKLLFIIGGVVALIIILVTSFLIIFNNPRAVYLRAINTAFNDVANGIENLLESDSAYRDLIGEGSMSIDGEIDWEVTLNDPTLAPMTEMINNFGINFNYAVDYDNEFIQYAAELNNDGESLLRVDGAFANDNLYYRIQGVTNNFIYQPMEGFDSLFQTEFEMDEINDVIRYLIRNFTREMHRSDFSSERTEVEIDGNTIRARKITYTFTPENTKAASLRALNALNDNADMKEKLSNFLNQDVEAVTEQLEEMISELEDARITNNDSFDVSVYVTGLTNRLVRIEFGDGRDTFTISKTRDGDYIFAYGDFEAKFETVNDDDFRVSISGDGFDATLDITSETNTVSDTEFEETITLALRARAAGQELVTAELNINTNIEFAEFEKLNLANARAADSLSVREQQQIQERIGALFLPFLMGM